MNKITYYFPFFIISLLVIKQSFIAGIKKHLKWFGIFLFYIHLMFLTYYIFNPFSLYLPGMTWLILSIIILEQSCYLTEKYRSDMLQKGKSDKFLLYTGYFYIIGFIVRHLKYLKFNPPMLPYFTSLNWRTVSAILAILVFIYWAFRQVQVLNKKDRTGKNAASLFIELALLFSILTVYVEIKTFLLPIIWMLASFLFMYIGKKFTKIMSRLGFYSLIFYWLSVFQVCFNTFKYSTPYTFLLDEIWIFGGIAILLQYIYIIIFHRITLLKTIEFPTLLNPLSEWAECIRKEKALWLFYPFFICIALFLYWSFRKSLLTLLCVSECLFIFIISLIYKKSHFHYFSLVGLTLCIIRLVFYDLVKAETLTRALVFLSIGIIMLVMNSIYTKYKERL